jgi:hypothetical protein
MMWGGLIALLLTGGVYLLCSSAGSGSLRSAGAYIVLLLLLILLGVQSTLMVGGFYAKGYVSDAQEVIAAVLPQTVDGVGDASPMSYDELRERVTDEYPLLGPLFDKIDPTAISEYIKDGGNAVAKFVGDNLTDSINYYIVRRVLWMVGFVVAAILAICLFFSNRSGGSGLDYSMDRYSSSDSSGQLQF